MKQDPKLKELSQDITWSEDDLINTDDLLNTEQDVSNTELFDNEMSYFGTPKYQDDTGEY